jgi:hypothetical protein
MKIPFACTLIFAFSAASLAWRDQEMEVKLVDLNKTQLLQLQGLQLNGDIWPMGDKAAATLYVTPDELQKLEMSGLPYQITISDLNEHYRDFWRKKHTASYYTCDQIIALADSLAEAFPAICAKIVAGRSIQNREIPVLKISDNVSVDENEPEVAFDAGIHGDEVIGPQNLITMARELCVNYASDTGIRKLVDTREIFLYLMINPDGRAGVTRYNANNVDINRDWGYMWAGQGSSTAPFSQQEIKIARDFLLSNQAVLEVTYHSGTEYILYPWGFNGEAPPDRAHHSYLANLYVSSSTYSSLPVYSSYDSYPTCGETIDYLYGAGGTAIMTEEISIDKQPADMTGYYNKNASAMKKMIEYAGYGIQGVVSDSISRKPVAAVLYVGQSFPCYSDPVVGDYHKFVIAGSYNIRAIANGYTTKTIGPIPVTDKSATTADIELAQDPAATSVWGYKVAMVHSGTGNTYAVLGPDDGKFFTLSGVQGMIIDMQYPVSDIAGKEITVYGAGYYTCYAGQTVDGPWKSLGTSATTGSFDLATGSLPEAQFLKVQCANCTLDAVAGAKTYETPTRIETTIRPAENDLTITRRTGRYELRISAQDPASLAIFTAQGRCCAASRITRGVYCWQPQGKGLFIVRLVSGKKTLTRRYIVY